MQREITQEIRERIQHLYYKAPCVYASGDDKGREYPETYPIELKAKYSSLLLSDLSDITDEDAIEIAKLATSWDDDSPLNPEDVPEWLDEVMPGNCATYADYVSGNQMIQLIDLLRSLGIATDAYGFTVQELIASGVYKIRSKE